MLQRAVRICIAEAGSATLDDVVSYLRDKARTHSAYFLCSSNNQISSKWCTTPCRDCLLALYMVRSSSNSCQSPWL